MVDCNKQLQAEGRSYPRTCQRCKFGPCEKFSLEERKDDFQDIEGFWWAVVDGETIVVEAANGSWFRTGFEAPVTLDKIGGKIPRPKYET